MRGKRFDAERNALEFGDTRVESADGRKGGEDQEGCGGMSRRCGHQRNEREKGLVERRKRKKPGERIREEERLGGPEMGGKGR